VTRVFLDSCIVIYLIQAPDPIRDAVREARIPGAVEDRIAIRILP